MWSLKAATALNGVPLQKKQLLSTFLFKITYSPPEYKFSTATPSHQNSHLTPKRLLPYHREKLQFNQLSLSQTLKFLLEVSMERTSKIPLCQAKKNMWATMNSTRQRRPHLSKNMWDLKADMA